MREREKAQARAGRVPVVLRVAVVLLVAASGAVEAFSFLGLDGVFAGVMTGNLALLGMAAGRAEPSLATAAVLALAGFGAGAVAVARGVRGRTAEADLWPRYVVVPLVCEAVLLVAVAWVAARGAPGGGVRNVLQAAVSFAMGTQSAAMVAAGRAASPTTYLTGTLSTFIVRSAGANRPGAWAPLRLAALVAGAAGSALLLKTAPGWAAALPAALVAGALLLVAASRAAARRTGD